MLICFKCFFHMSILSPNAVLSWFDAITQSLRIISNIEKLFSTQFLFGTFEFVRNTKKIELLNHGVLLKIIKTKGMSTWFGDRKLSQILAICTM